MKKILTTLTFLGLFAFTTSNAYAYTVQTQIRTFDNSSLTSQVNSSNTNFTTSLTAVNPVVAHYMTGTHAIAGMPGDYTGWDMVFMTNTPWNFRQMFCGHDPAGKFLCIQTLWQPAENGVCPSSDWILVPGAYPGWGDYLKPGVDYCAKNTILPYSSNSCQY